MEKINFSDLGRIEAVNRLFEEAGKSFRRGTAFPGMKNGIVRTSSALWIEGIDFDLTYFPLKHLGYKCVTAATGELLATLAGPVSLSVRIGVSAKLDYPQISEIWSGMVTAAREFGFTCLDLDLGPSRNGLIISVSVTGESDTELENSRKPGKSKDLICISGNVGGAYLGMRLLEREKERLQKAGDLSGKMDIDHFRMIVSAYLKPEINSDILNALKDSGITPSYGYLVNRGLADAAKRLSRDSALGVKLYSDKIPLEGNSFELGRILDVDPVSAAMNGGEDYRLMFVVPMSDYDILRHDFQSFSIIGHLAKSDVGTVIVMPTGAELPIHAQGWKESE